MKLTEQDRSFLATLGPDVTDAATLADALDEPRRSLEDRLAELADNGLVEDLGDGRYRRTESGRRLLATAGEVTDDASGSAGDATDPLSSVGGTRDDAIDTSPAIEEAIASFDLGPEGDAAVRSTYAFLRYWGEATVDEIIDAIYPERPAGYNSPDEWWEACVADVLVTIPEVEASPDSSGSDTWRYTGTPEIESPDSDGFLPSERRGHHLYGSVKHAIESLDLSTAERDAVRAAFGELRRQGEARADEIATSARETCSVEDELANASWDDLIGEVFASLPGVSRTDGDRWRYDLPPAA